MTFGGVRLIINLSKDELVTFKFRRKFFEIDDIPKISLETIEKGRCITEEARTGWDFGEIHSQFPQSLLKGLKPENVDGAFINFVKKKVAVLPNS